MVIKMTKKIKTIYEEERACWSNIRKIYNLTEGFALSSGFIHKEVNG